MDKIGLKQLLERFKEINVRLEVLKGKHDLRTYLELAEFSRDISNPLVFEFDSTSIIYQTLAKELEEHKEISLIGITKYIDNIMDRVRERVSDGKRYDRLETYFNLLNDYALPSSFSGQARRYSEEMDNISHSLKDMFQTCSEAA